MFALLFGNLMCCLRVVVALCCENVCLFCLFVFVDNLSVFVVLFVCENCVARCMFCELVLFMLCLLL